MFRLKQSGPLSLVLGPCPGWGGTVDSHVGLLAITQWHGLEPNGRLDDVASVKVKDKSMCRSLLKKCSQDGTSQTGMMIVDPRDVHGNGTIMLSH